MGSVARVSKQCVMLVLLEGLLGVILSFLVDEQLLYGVIGASVVALIFFLAVSYIRHKEILHLSSEIDEVLHGSRQVKFSHCKEGDVAILENELSKMVARLSHTHSLQGTDPGC